MNNFNKESWTHKYNVGDIVRVKGEGTEGKVTEKCIGLTYKVEFNDKNECPNWSESLLELVKK
jgi:hypothetical protein